MKCALTIFTFCLSQLIFAQKEDSLMLVIDQVEISSIRSPKEITSYFKDISNLTSTIKKTKTEIVESHGFRSQQHDSILSVQESINSFLLLKMREYLSYHPYPRQIPGDTVRSEETNEVLFVQVDVTASSALINVFINAPDTRENLDFKKLYFPKFYPAFQLGHIYSGDMWNLLHGMYRQEKKEEYLNLELGEDEQIEQMINALQVKRRPRN